MARPSAPTSTASRRVEPEILTPAQVAHHDELRRLEQIADWLDSRFRVPGTSIRFGLDSIIGLLPGVGDSISMLPAVYLVHRARQLGAPRRLQARMAMNVGLDLLVGAVPLVGDLFDVGFKSNRRNVELLRRHLMATR